MFVHLMAKDSETKVKYFKRNNRFTYMRRKCMPDVPFYFRSKYLTYYALKRLKKAVLDKDINWRTLYKLIKTLKFNQETLPYCISFLIELLKFLEKHECRDISLIREIMKIILHGTQASNIQTTLKFAQKMKTRLSYVEGIGDRVSYCRQNYETDGIPCEDYVWLTAAAGNVCLLKLMLRFGMGMVSIKRSTVGFEDMEYIQQLRLNHTDITNEEWIQICKCFSSANRSLSPNRIMLITKVLDLLRRIKAAPDYYDNFVTCYRLLYDSVEEPYMSVTELRTSLESALSSVHHGRLLEVVEKFGSLFPDVPQISETRSLQHLCRIEIRKRLRENFNLPHGVSKLNLPNILKQYVLLNDDCDYSVMTKTSWNVDFYNVHIPTSTINIPKETDSILRYLRDL